MKSIRGVAIRLGFSMVFTVLWKMLVMEKGLISSPLVFCGMVCVGAGWLSYLKRDGIKIPMIGRKDSDTDRTSEGGSANADSGIAANFIAGTLLIGVSFLVGTL